jgi:hypothetical protein
MNEGCSLHGINGSTAYTAFVLYCMLVTQETNCPCQSSSQHKSSNRRQTTVIQSIQGQKLKLLSPTYPHCQPHFHWHHQHWLQQSIMHSYLAELVLHLNSQSESDESTARSTRWSVHLWPLYIPACPSTNIIQERSQMFDQPKIYRSTIRSLPAFSIANTQMKGYGITNIFHSIE